MDDVMGDVMDAAISNAITTATDNITGSAIDTVNGTANGAATAASKGAATGTAKPAGTERYSLSAVLELLLSIEQEKIRIWEKELSELPKGSLYLSGSRKRTYFYYYIDGRKRGVSRDLDFVYKLARKRYLQEKLQDHEESICRLRRQISSGRRSTSALSKRRGSGLETLLRRYGEAGLDILRITCSQEQYRWVHARFRSNPAPLPKRTYRTYSGIIVRSKSEQTIGNALETRGVPYRYEMEFSFETGWMEPSPDSFWGKYRNFYPDFVILTAAGDYILWEHFGCVEQSGYRTHAMEKICAYRQGGGFTDELLIMTFEEDLQDLSTLDRIIQLRVFPYI